MLVALLFIQGCGYAISPGVAEQADKSITFSELEAHPEWYAGKMAIFGGTIDRIRNTAQATVIDVTQKKLDRWGKPLPSRWSAGSFIVVHPGFLDTLAYAPGRDITVAGVVQGPGDPALNDLNVASPVILSRELKLWPRERPSWNRPQYLDPLYDPYTSPRRF
jgi:outer membrane lipoprotein